MAGETIRGFAAKEEDDYFPYRRRKCLFFGLPLQGRTAFGQTHGQTITRKRTWLT